MLQLLLGQIPEAIFFALFMIFVKDLKEKRILYITLMTIEYMILITLLPYNIWFQILYTFMSYLILKILYKEKAQIIDIFTFIIAGIIIILVNAILYFIIANTLNNFYVYVILDRIVLFSIILIFNKKLNKIQKMYKKFWNRNDKIKKPIKSVTFRAINIIIFNMVFYILNIIMIYSLILGRR